MKRLFSLRQWSVGVQTFWAILLVSLLLLWIGSTVLSQVVHSIQRDQIEGELDKRVALFSTTLIDALLSEDIPILETTLSGLVEIHPDLVGAEFCDYQNQPLLQWGENAPSCGETTKQEESTTRSLFTTQRPIIFEGERFGQVALRWDLSQQFFQLEKQIQQFVQYLAFSVLLIALLLFLIVRRLVVRPIRRVDAYLRGVESGRSMEAVAPFSSKELSHLGDGVEILRKSLAAEAALRGEREALLATLEQKVLDRTRDLKQSNDQLSSIMEHMGDALFVLDRHQQIIVRNPAAAQLFTTILGEKEGGDQFEALFPAGQRGKIETWFKEEAVQIETLSLTDRFQNPLLLELSFTPLPVEHDRQQKLVLIRDVTKQRELEEKEQMVAFQSGIAEMSISIMHNIGNILAGVSGQFHKIKQGGKALLKTQKILQQLPEKQLPEDTRNQVLNKSIEIVEKTVNQEVLRPMERVERGMSEITSIIHLQKSNVEPILQHAHFHPRAFLQDVVTLLEPQWKPFEIEVEIAVEADLNEVWLPRNQLFQVVSNLVENAIDAVKRQPSMKGIIRLELSQQHTEEQRLQFVIEDNGVGVASEEAIATIFKPHHMSTDAHHGMGLHACANFIHSYGGEIRFDSDGEGRGATVTFWLPLQQPSDEPRSQI